MDQVGGSGIVDADRFPPWHQQMLDAANLATGLDFHLAMLRQNTREKISEYLGRRPMATNGWTGLPDLVRQLEEVLFRQNPNKSDYYNMMKGPIEPNLLLALTILGDGQQQIQQNQQLSRHITSSDGHGMTLLTHGITLGVGENSRMSGVPYTNGSSFGAGWISQSANMGTSLSGEAHDKHVNTHLSLGVNPTHNSSRVSNNNLVINMMDTFKTEICPKVRLSPLASLKEVLKKPKFSCPVCLHELVDASSTLCGHIFCQECIRASIKAQRKCPTCRKKLKMNNFHRIYLPTME